MGQDDGKTTVVAIGFPSTAAERAAMREEMGPGYVIEDIRRAPASAQLVLVPPCSPQALRSLQVAYPEADIVVVDEASHPDRGAAFRAINAGAREYATVSDLLDLGRRLRRWSRGLAPGVNGAA
jgi:hypothetical protein